MSQQHTAKFHSSIEQDVAAAHGKMSQQRAIVLCCSFIFIKPSPRQNILVADAISKQFEAHFAHR
jgi:hypothetical protein